jgi:hypothetical protein
MHTARCCLSTKNGSVRIAKILQVCFDSSYIAILLYATRILLQTFMNRKKTEFEKMQKTSSF